MLEKILNFRAQCPLQHGCESRAGLTPLALSEGEKRTEAIKGRAHSKSRNVVTFVEKLI